MPHLDQLWGLRPGGRDRLLKRRSRPRDRLGAPNDWLKLTVTRDALPSNLSGCEPAAMPWRSTVSSGKPSSIKPCSPAAVAMPPWPVTAWDTAATQRVARTGRRARGTRKATGRTRAGRQAGAHAGSGLGEARLRPDSRTGRRFAAREFRDRARWRCGVAQCRSWPADAIGPINCTSRFRWQAGSVYPSRYARRVTHLDAPVVRREGSSGPGQWFVETAPEFAKLANGCWERPGSSKACLMHWLCRIRGRGVSFVTRAGGWWRPMPPYLTTITDGPISAAVSQILRQQINEMAAEIAACRCSALE